MFCEEQEHRPSSIGEQEVPDLTKTKYLTGKQDEVTYSGEI